MSLAAILLVLMSSAGPAGDVPPSSLTMRFEEGRILFDGGRYAEAAEVFSELHGESGDAALLFPTAQSLRLAGRCREALTAYQGFVDASAELHVRAQTASSAARLERLASDLTNAQARLVQMRRCVARSSGQRAQTEARLRRAAGDPQGAIGLLSRLWEQTKDPTILPDLAYLHRMTGNCGQARTLLELAVQELTPVEVIALGEADDPDLDAGRIALEEARAALAGPPCTVPQPAPPPPVERHELQAMAVAPGAGPRLDATGQQAERDTPRWYVWAAGGLGAALVIGGGVCFWKLHEVQDQVDSYRKKGWDPVEGPRLLDRGDAYQRAAVGLFVTGGVLVVGASLYALVAHDRKTSSRPVIQTTGIATRLGWAFDF